MIAKVRLGRSFSGVVRYFFDGHHDDLHANKQAEILASNGVRLGSIDQMIADFNRHRLINPDLGVAVWHTALSFHAEDTPKLTQPVLIGLAEEYMKGLKLDPQNVQWLLVKHNDTDHPHVHLLMSRVDFDGLTIDRSFSKKRSRKAVTQIARRHGLTVAEDRKRPNYQYQKPLTNEQIETQTAIRQAIDEELPYCSILPELAQRLASHGIHAHFQRRKQKGDEGPITGVVFERNGQFVRGSRLGEGYSAGALNERLRSGPAQVLKTVEKQNQRPDRIELKPTHIPSHRPKRGH